MRIMVFETWGVRLKVERKKTLIGLLVAFQLLEVVRDWLSCHGFRKKRGRLATGKRVSTNTHRARTYGVAQLVPRPLIGWPIPGELPQN